MLPFPATPAVSVGESSPEFKLWLQLELESEPEPEVELLLLHPLHLVLSGVPGWVNNLHP